jgi:AhpD family alkylhydroperoxidase
LENQIEYYNETGKYRDMFDEGLPVAMTAYSTFRKAVYKDGAIDAKTKRLIALAAGLTAGCTRCIIGQTKDAVKAGATKAEILETVAVAIVMGGTAVSAESWRVAKALVELGKW